MIQIQGLNFTHNRKKKALFDHLDCQVQAGSIVGLLGKNGAGKTTLLKLLTGQLYPGSGHVKVNDHFPAKRQPSFLQELFFVSEEFYLPPASIRQYIKAYAGFYPRFDHESLAMLLKEFELPETKNLQKLSYGQKKKFLISFALSTKCKLLILDEPTNGLDIPSKSTFRKVVAGTLDEDQLVMISTHQVKDVENLIDRILLIENGQIILQKDLFDLASKLAFSFSHNGEGEEVLYSEMVPGGYKVITPQQNGHSSVDIELLFNAITVGDQKFMDYVNQ